MSLSAAARVSLDTREDISVAKQCCTLTRYDRSFQHGGYIPSGDGPGVRKTQDPPLSRRRTFSANELTFATTRAARGRYAALVPRHVDQAVDAERDERQNDEEDDDDDGDDIVFLHDC